MNLVGTLARFDERTVRMALAGVLVLVLAAAVTYLVVPEGRALRDAWQAREALRNTIGNRTRMDAEIAALGGHIEDLQKRLHGDMASRPVRQMESYIIGRLQAISWRHKVELRGVTPGQGRQVRMFREIMFDVQLAGGYFALVDWLRDLSRELGFVVVKEYELVPATRDTRDPPLLLKLKMVSYRSEAAA